MRLLWLIDSFNVGGAESLAVTFARRVDRGEIELFVASLGSVGGNPLEKEFRDAGVPTINLGAKSLRDRAAFRRLVAFVREHRIELVHAHLTYAAIWSALLSRATGVR
ncbi:MAG TPA: glycosyltransferase, partial [Thermoanaerobaculia bacterium]|nr:glycosyltransferase [Thermoanaerobaculia bacterium]